MYKEFPESQGFWITGSSNGVDALATFKANPSRFDLVLSDYSMPGMTGKQLIPELLDVRSDIPIIMSTGYAELMSKQEADALGIRDYLIKPVRLAHLRDCIVKCLS